MTDMKKIYTISLLLFIYVNGSSQVIKDWKLFPSKDTAQNDSTVTEAIIDSVYEITPANKPGKITVNKDTRIDAVSIELATPNDGVSVKIRGYRVQIIASHKKTIIDTERAKFLAVYLNIDTYTDWVQPNYKLKVGDFKTKLEAQKLQYDLRLSFPSALVINDLIELPKISN
jgi:hypothetical protein